VWPRSRLRSRAGKSVCKGWEYPLPLYVLSFYSKNVHVGLITCCVVRLWPRVKSNAGSPDVERCKHVKSRATTVYFRLGRLRRVSTYVQQMWGIIGHVTVEAGNTVGTDGAPPQQVPLAEDNRRKDETRQVWRKTKKRQEPVPEQKNQKNAIYKYKGRPIQNSKNKRLPVGFSHQLTFSF